MEHLIIYFIGVVFSTIFIFCLTRIAHDELSSCDYCFEISQIEKDSNYNKDIAEPKIKSFIGNINNKKFIKALVVSLIPFLNLIVAAVGIMFCIVSLIILFLED